MPFNRRVILSDQKHDETIKGDELHIRTPDMSCYMFNEKKPGEDFYKGQVLINGKEEKANFLLAEVDKGIAFTEVQRVSVTCSIPNVIRTFGLGLGLSEEGQQNESVYVAYEQFECKYASETWRTEANLSETWWKDQIRSLLETLSAMKYNALCHGKLDNLDHYVIVGEKPPRINLINVGRKTSEIEQTIREQWEEDDKNMLCNFFINEAVSKLGNDVDWSYFMDSVPHSQVDQLRKHPLLLTPRERYKYYYEIFATVNIMSADTKKQFEEELDKYPFHDWDKDFKNDNTHVLYKIKTYNPIKREYGNYPKIVDRTPTGLLHFVQDALEHINKEVKKVSTLIPERHVSNMFPGFLSALHNILVIHFQADITRNHPSVSLFKRVRDTPPAV